MKCFGFITKHVHLILKRNKNGSLVVGLGPFGNPFSFFGNPIRKKSKPPNAPPQNQQSSTIHYLTKPPLSPPQQQKKRKKNMPTPKHLAVERIASNTLLVTTPMLFRLVPFFKVSSITAMCFLLHLGST